MKSGFVVGALALVAGAAIANGAVIAQWNVVTAFPTGTGNVPTGTAYGIGAADTGALTAGTNFRAEKLLAASTYTSPAGNGSQFAFSANNWSAGDFWEAAFSTTGYESITVSWDQARSSTGPATFDLQMSVDGTPFVTLLNDYTVLQSGGGGAPGTWSSSGARNALYTTTVSLGSIASDEGTVRLRFVSQVTTAAGGASRIDNISIEGTLIPAPGAMALMGLGGLVAARRRR